MIDSNYRTAYQRFFIEPLLNFSWFASLSPHLITLIGCISGIAIVPLLYFHHNLLAFCFLLFSGYCDTLDGSLARIQKKSSPKGAVLDIYCDRIVELSVITGLYLYAPMERAPYILLMLGSVLLCITAFLVVGIFTENQSQKSFYYSCALIERTEAFIFFATMILIPKIFMPLALLFFLLVTLSSLIHLKGYMRYG